MKIVIAIDSFKGCLSSVEANAAAREGVLLACPAAEVVTVPISDGGEGWIEAYHSACGGEMIEVTACDPLRRPVTASYLIQGQTAVIEVAKVIGLNLLLPEERNPLIASSYGVGQLIIDALQRGCKQFIIGLGGSATSDAGQGMMEALQGTFLPTDVQFTIASDVANPLYGPKGAAAVFGPQKGATSQMVKELDHRARLFAEEAATKMHIDKAQSPGAGAAGGLGYALMQFMNARQRSGIELLTELTDFDRQLADACLVITGEGRADSQTVMGKAPMGILNRAKSHSVPVVLVAGQINDRIALLQAGFAEALCTNPPTLPEAEAMRKEVAQENIRLTAKLLVNSLTVPK